MIKAKKSLGQNFLIDDEIIEKIVNYTKIENKIVLEIGPGTGNLTNSILKKKPKELCVIEKDNDLVEELKNKFQDKIKIIHNDVLKVQENKLFKEKAIVFGNLPYNISTEILSKWISNFNNYFWFESLILMFQKEVAERIVGNYSSSNYGRLSILSNWKLSIKKICDVSPISFYPKPKVYSSVLFFEPKKNYYKIKDLKNLETVTRVFFSNRRKMIKKPFNKLFNGNKKILEKYKIDLNLRPQNLDYETYYKLTKDYENL